MQLHLFTGSAVITTAEKSFRWRDALGLLSWMPSEDLAPDVVSHSSVISRLCCTKMLGMIILNGHGVGSTFNA